MKLMNKKKSTVYYKIKKTLQKIKTKNYKKKIMIYINKMNKKSN